MACNASIWRNAFGRNAIGALRLAGRHQAPAADLVIGSGLEFEARGAHKLKGVPGEWRLFVVTSP